MSAIVVVFICLSALHFAPAACSGRAKQESNFELARTASSDSARSLSRLDPTLSRFLLGICEHSSTRRSLARATSKLPSIDERGRRSVRRSWSMLRGATRVARTSLELAPFPTINNSPRLMIPASPDPGVSPLHSNGVSSRELGAPGPLVAPIFATRRLVIELTSKCMRLHASRLDHLVRLIYNAAVVGVRACCETCDMS